MSENLITAENAEEEINCMEKNYALKHSSGRWTQF